MYVLAKKWVNFTIMHFGKTNLIFILVTMYMYTSLLFPKVPNAVIVYFSAFNNGIL